MAPRHVNAKVMRGESMVDQVERPVRRTPSGGLGVEYLGVIYALAPGGCIDLDGPWYYPADAPICLDPPEVVEAPVERHWALDLEGQRPYVFLNGGRTQLLEVVRRLERAGFAPEHWGPSFREGVDGVSYDWFVRLPLNEEDRVGEWDLEQVMAGLAVDQPQAVGVLGEDALADENDKLLRQIVDLEAQLAYQVQRSDAAELLAAETQRSYRLEITRTRDAAAFLRAAVRQLKAGSAETTQAPSGQAEAALAQSLETTKRELGDALSQWMASEEQREAAVEELRSLRERIALLEAREAARQSPASRTSGKAKASVRDVEAALEVFAPTISLVRGSAEFIATEVADRGDVYTKLRNLEVERTALKAKRVQGADGWLELHFSTGLARDGRLYFRKQEAGATGWHVLVSDKAAQPTDIDWMARQ